MILKLARAIKQLRVRAKYKQDYIAQKLFVSPSTYRHYENGLRLPDIFTIQKIAGLYGLTIDDILKIDDLH